VKIFKHMLAFSAVLTLLISIFAVSALAAPIDQEVSGSLTIQALYDDMPVSGMQFSIYRVGDVKGSLPEITLTGEYAAFSIDPKNMDYDSWDSLAMTLHSFVTSRGIQADTVCVSQSNGVAVATELPVGLYLVTANRVTEGLIRYSAAPFIISIPTRADVASPWSYSPTALPKISRSVVETISLSVLKIWDDWWYQGSRPNSVIVNLYCDGVKYDSVTLSERGSWRYQWDNLIADHDWMISEEYVKDYMVTIHQSGNKFTISNRYNGDVLPPPEAPLRRLPQTGLTWWPILCLGGIGILFILFGAVGMVVSKRHIPAEGDEMNYRRYHEEE